MGVPVSFDGKLVLPGDEGLQAENIPVVFSGQYDSRDQYVYVFPAGAGSQTVNFGTMPAAGAKVVVIKYKSATGAPPVLIKKNGSLVGDELSTGGCQVFVNPVPAAGITSMVIEYTGAGTISVWLLG